MEQNNIEYKYLAYIGLYTKDGYGIGLDKSFEELNQLDIDAASYMLCRDLETGASLKIWHDNIQEVLNYYGDNLLRKLEGTYSIGEISKLSLVLDDLKASGADDKKILDDLWAESYNFNKNVTKSKR